MANITEHSELSVEGVDVSTAGKQRFLFTNALNGTVTLTGEKDFNVMVTDENGNKQRAIAVANIAEIGTDSVKSVNGKVDVVVLDGSNINATVGVDTDTINNHLKTIKQDVDEIGDSVTDLRNDAVLKSTASSQSLKGSLTIQDELNVVGGVSEAFKISFANGQATVSTNNGLDIISPTTFARQPATESETSFATIANGALVSKSQVQEAINSVTGTHFDKWVIMGKPADIKLTTTLQPVYWTATTRFPNLPPADIVPTEDGTGVTFKKAGLIHIKRKVSLGGANTENLYYEMRINNQTLEPLQAQAISVSKNTMSYDVEFYWQVSANQTVSIWANCLTDTCNLNYKGVTTLIEYL